MSMQHNRNKNINHDQNREVTCCVMGQSAQLLLYYWQMPLFKRIRTNAYLLQQQP